MGKDPAFLFYTSDFIMGTMFMTDDQVGIYIRMLCAQHQHGGLIDKVSFNSKVGNNNIVRSKFIETEDGFYNERLFNEMAKRSKKSTNLSINAKKRWEKKCKSNAMAMQGDMPTENENENVIKEDRGVGKGEFNAIWELYPVKDGKKAAERYFNASVKTKEDVGNIHKALKNYLGSKKVKEGYIKNGSTWFNNWTDWITYKDPEVVDDKPWIRK